MEKETMSAGAGLIIIGGSAGSLDVILKAIAELDSDMGVPLIIAVHRRNSSDGTLSDLLSSRTTHPVKEAEEKEMIMPGTIYLAPPDYHLLIENDHTFSLDDSEKVNFSRPSIDIVFNSAAEIYGKSLVCVLLSGANADGVEGLISVKELGGMAAVQDPATAEVPFMPQQALLQMKPDQVIKGDNLGAFLNGLKNS